MFFITLQNGGTEMSGSMIATMYACVSVCVCDRPSWRCQSQAPPGPLWLNPSSHCLSHPDKQSDRPPWTSSFPGTGTWALTGQSKSKSIKTTNRMIFWPHFYIMAIWWSTLLPPDQDGLESHLGHLHSRHGIDMEAEDLWPVVANHKALHLLLVYGKVARLDVEVTIAREAQHVLTLGVPGHTVSIRLLQGKQKGGGR